MPQMYKPANYPVFRQALISALFLLPLAMGVWLVLGNEGEDLSTTNTLTIEPLPQNITPEVLDTEMIEIEASAAMVYDVRTDTVLFAKNETDVHSLASITKLMTALLVTELIDTHDTVITVSEAAVRQYGESGLRIGERVSADNLNQYSLLSSSNDAAYALAYSIGEDLFTGEGAKAFVDAMNVRAKELGLNDTVFQNPTGLDISTVESGALGTAKDVTTLMTFIVLNHDELIASTRSPEELIFNEQGEFHRAANTNPLVDAIPNLLGSKTGFTDLAGGNLVIAFDAGFNRPIVITVLDSSWSGRFSDVQTLVDATISHLGNDLTE